MVSAAGTNVGHATTCGREAQCHNAESALENFDCHDSCGMVVAWPRQAERRYCRSKWQKKKSLVNNGFTGKQGFKTSSKYHIRHKEKEIYD